MFELIKRKSTDRLHSELELSDKQHYIIELTETLTSDDSFDGGRATIHVFTSGKETEGTLEYDCKISPQAFVYYLYGEES